jgi:hypothetical protein
MVAEIARSGKEGWPAILVAAVTGNAGGPRERGVDAGTVVIVEGEGEQAQIVGAMLAFAEPRTDDHRGDRRLLEDPAGRDVGDRDAVPAGHLGQGGQDRLQHGPAADRIDEALVLHLAPVADRVRLRPTEPAIAEEPAGEGAIGQEPDSALEAEPAHLLAGTAVQQRETDLVGHDRKAVHDQQPQMVGVEIGQAKMGDFALAPQLRQPAHGIEIARVVEQPPMQLEQVDALDAQAGEAAADAGANDVRRHLARLGAPFGKHRGALAGRHALQQPARDLLGTAIMVGHVEGVEARVGVGAQGSRGAVEIERPAIALHVRHLPQPGDHAADGEPGSELATVRPGGRVLGHTASSAAMVLSGTGLSGGRGAKNASSSKGRPSWWWRCSASSGPQ